MLYYMTLGPDSVEGDCFGDLRLFFTTQNSDDYTPTPSPGVWTSGGIKPQAFTLQPCVSITVSFGPVTGGVPGDMYPWFLVGGPITGMNPLGQGTGGFFPNAQRSTKWFGEDSNQNDQISWTTGFLLDVPWTGVSANCSGMWWLKWGPK
jgi:hypothetical protein